MKAITDWMTSWQRRAAAEGWALVPLRLLVGFGFAAHGYAKLARGPASFAAALAGMGIPAPGPMAWVTALLEFLGGVAIMLGAYVVPLTLPFMVVMATAMFGAHLRYGFSSIKLKAITASGAEFGPPGYELNLLYITALLALAWSGPTAWSFDRWRAVRRARGATPMDCQL
ncbi:MAG TPA: DoxX family protein [Kofleriaceae bacterium]|nr:DoxX family protein [Kofleriaceae bacterium]